MVSVRRVIFATGREIGKAVRLDRPSVATAISDRHHLAKERPSPQGRARVVIGGHDPIGIRPVRLSRRAPIVRSDLKLDRS